MRDFVFAAATDGSPLASPLLDRLSHAVSPDRASVTVRREPGACCILAGRSDADLMQTARLGDWSAWGYARLVHVGGAPPSANEDGSDLLRVLHSISEEPECPRGLIGEIAVCCWNAARRTLVVVRDALGIQPLFYRLDGPIVLVGSRVAFLGRDDSLDETFVGDTLVSGYHFGLHTVFSDVRRVAPGTCLVARDGRTTTKRYWDVQSFSAGHPVAEAEAIIEFRRLFSEGVRWCIDPVEPTWSQLSGGLDSSSIVSTAQWLAGQHDGLGGVAGTITYVDTIAGGDEREFADAVLAKYKLPTERLVDFWLWQPDGGAPPLVDDPTPFYPFYARERFAGRFLRSRGARILLSGLGSDHYLIGNRYFVADLMVRGKFLAAAQAVADRAIARRQSFWRLFYAEAMLPIRSRQARRREIMRRNRMPSWLGVNVPSASDLWNAHPALQPLNAPHGRQYEAMIADNVSILHTQMDRLIAHEGVSVRYPFMYQPLLEFALQLPPAMRTRPLQNKWVLRQAMTGILPEEVRTRDGKGSIGARVRWSFARERRLIDWLLHEPLLGDLGYVKPDALRAAFARALEGRVRYTDALVHAFALEMWLRVRSGRWPSSDQSARLAS